VALVAQYERIPQKYAEVSVGWLYPALKNKTGGARLIRKFYVDEKRTANAHNPAADPEAPAA
jgi:hypothetical protein